MSCDQVAHPQLLETLPDGIARFAGRNWGTHVLTERLLTLALGMRLERLLSCETLEDLLRWGVSYLRWALTWIGSQALLKEMKDEGVARMVRRAVNGLFEVPGGVIVYRVPEVLVDAALSLSKAGLLELLCTMIGRRSGVEFKVEAVR